jgi:exopolysaccharide biosynthesis polyprenyl glycosylphosphotransferase
VTTLVEAHDDATGPGPPAVPAPALSRRAVAAGGRYVLVWLPLAVLAAADQPLHPLGLVTVSVIAALWLACLRAAFASAPYALGPWVPAALGTFTGLVCVAALNPHLPALHLSPGALVGAAAGIVVSIGVWEWVIERTLCRRRVLFVGSDGHDEIEAAVEGGRPAGLELLRAPADDPPAEALPDALVDVVRAQRPDLIVLTDDTSSPAALDRLLDICDGRFRVANLISFYEYALGWVPLHRITPMWFLSLIHVRQQPYGRAVKRAFDLVVASAGLLVTAPLLPLIALAVRRTPGPVIFRQVRVGEGGRRFVIYKFRTMVHDAERPGEAVLAVDRDPRTTRIGAFLRRTHLDELPQLVNVIKGDMSMVGPRPERPEFIAMLEDSIPFWNRRLLIKPGMTGWAQVHCGYASDREAMYEKLAYDFWYLRHRNLTVDLAICVRTLKVVVDILIPARPHLRPTEQDAAP